VDRYSFFVKDFHLLHHAGFRRRFHYVPYFHAVDVIGCIRAGQAQARTGVAGSGLGF